MQLLAARHDAAAQESRDGGFGFSQCGGDLGHRPAVTVFETGPPGGLVVGKRFQCDHATLTWLQWRATRWLGETDQLPAGSNGRLVVPADCSEHFLSDRHDAAAWMCRRTASWTFWLRICRSQAVSSGSLFAPKLPEATDGRSETSAGRYPRASTRRRNRSPRSWLRQHPQHGRGVFRAVPPSAPNRRGERESMSSRRGFMGA